MATRPVRGHVYLNTAGDDKVVFRAKGDTVGKVTVTEQGNDTPTIRIARALRSENNRQLSNYIVRSLTLTAYQVYECPVKITMRKGDVVTVEMPVAGVAGPPATGAVSANFEGLQKT